MNSAERISRACFVRMTLGFGKAGSVAGPETSGEVAAHDWVHGLQRIGADSMLT